MMFYDWYLRNQEYKEEYSKAFLMSAKYNLVIIIYYRKSKIYIRQLLCFSLALSLSLADGCLFTICSSLLT